MDRFYRASLESISNREQAEDIDCYVRYLTHINSVLISELAKSGTLGARELLRQIGFPVRISLSE